MNRRVAARDFESELVSARDLTRDLARALALAQDLERAQDLARTRDLAHDLARSRDLARDLAQVLELVRYRDLARDLARAHILAQTREIHLIYVPSSDSDGRPLIRELIHAHKLARSLDLALEQIRGLDQRYVAPAGARLTLGRVPRGLVALAVRLLPAAQRPRYAAEFRNELAELRRRERWGYSLRVLANAWELRRALVEPVRTPDGDVARRAER